MAFPTLAGAHQASPLVRSSWQRFEAAASNATLIPPAPAVPATQDSFQPISPTADAPPQNADTPATLPQGNQLPPPPPGPSAQTPYAPYQALQDMHGATHPGGAKQIFHATTPGGYPLCGFMLPNGHRVFVEQRPATNVISLRTFVNAGSVLENPVNDPHNTGPFQLPSGIAHLDEHLHFVSHQQFPQPNAWVRHVEQFGAEPNASTDHEVIQHELTFHGEDFNTLAQLHAEEVLRPVYNHQNLFQEKRNVLNESSERMQSPQVQGETRLFDMMFKRPHFQTLGTPEDILRTTPEDVQRYYRLAYQPANLLTVVSGNVKPDQVLQALAPHLLSNPNPNDANLVAVQQQALSYQQAPGTAQVAKYVDPQLEQAFVMFGFKGPSLRNPKDRAAMECLLTYLAADAQSPLPGILEERMGLLHTLNVELTPLKKDGAVVLSYSADPSRVNQSVNAFRKVLHQYSRQELCPILLNNVKARLKTNFEFSQQDVYNSTMQMGSEGIADSLNYWLNYKHHIDSVTPRDIQRVANEYLRPDQFSLVVGMPGTQRGFTPTRTIPLDNAGNAKPPEVPNHEPPSPVPLPVGGPALV